jgi:hypothetical protein
MVFDRDREIYVQNPRTAQRGLTCICVYIRVRVLYTLSGDKIAVRIYLPNAVTVQQHELSVQSTLDIQCKACAIQVYTIVNSMHA